MVNTGASFSSRSIGFKPKQNIPESEKNREWCIENVDWCISMSPVWWKSRTDDLYNLYNGKRDQTKWETLTKTFGVEFPVGKVKHIPLVRPMINRLVSEQEERPFNYTTHSEDAESIHHKVKDISEKMLNDILTVIKNPEADVDEEILKIQKQYKEEYQSDMEIGVHHAVKSYLMRHHLDRKLSENFLDKLITGREYYQVKINRVGEDPDFEVIKPGTIFFADNNAKWVNECDWAVHVLEMTPTEILDKYGDRMSSGDVKIVEDWLDMYHKDALYKLTSPADADRMLDRNPVDDRTISNASVNHKIAVYKVEWKSIRRIAYIENENKYVPDAPYIKILSQENLQELKENSPGRYRKVKYRYIQDRWEGVRIGDSIYVDLGKSKYPIRSMSSPSKVKLSYNGLTYNGKLKPYSLMGETEDLQDLYDVLHFHKENLIALSGVKGMVMDLSQIPDFKTGSFAGNLKMFMYYKKLGTAFIDRSPETADKNFNQFQTYDDTLGAGMKVIIDMITHVEQTAERITGVSRQSMGDIGQYDGKGNTDQAIMQSSLVTEYMFNDHDEFVEYALTDLANALRVAWKNGYTGYYISDQHTREIFTLNPEFALHDYNIFFTNRSSDKKDIAELKLYASQLATQQLLQFEDILPLFKKSSLTDIIKYIEGNIIRRRKQLEEKQQQMMEMQGQLEQAKSEAEVQKLRADIAKISADISDNQKKLAIEEKEVADKKMIDLQKVKLDQQRVDLEAKQLQFASNSKLQGSAEVKNK